MSSSRSRSTSSSSSWSPSRSSLSSLLLSRSSPWWSSSPSPSPSRKFILRSSDGKSYELDGKAALQSRMIRDMIDDDCPDDVIPVPALGDILSKVVVYCQKHAEYDYAPVPSPDTSHHVLSTLDRQLLDWDRDFVKLDRLTVSRITLAANYLNINSLLNLTCQSLAENIQPNVHSRSLSQERPPKCSSVRVSHAGKANSAPIAKIKDMGARRFFVVYHWESDESTYKVKKIVNAFNNSRVPPPDVLEVVVWPPPFSESIVQSSLRGDFQLATEIRGRNDSKTCAWELNAKMVVETGISWVIVGHSYRRHLYHDSDEIVGDKVAYAFRYGLKVIACVGGGQEDCRSMDVITAQTKAIAGRVSNWENIILAYNPLQHVATSSQAQEVHAGLRRWLHDNVSPEVASMTRIIYGGYVGVADWEQLAMEPDIDGFIVGGLSPVEFIDIIKFGAETKVD